MKNLLIKEMKLGASPLTYWFLAFSMMTLLPGYPILLGAFFVSFGIFQSFQRGRENNDILYTILLPVKKSDAVKAKFIFVCTIEWIAFVGMLLLTFFRMGVLYEADPYVNNALMNANPLFLAFALVIFGLFNGIFVRGFFKTAYRYGVPFVTFIVVGFLTIFVGEALHHVPGLEYLNTTALPDVSFLWVTTLAGAVFYIVVTWLAYRSSVKRFEQVDF